MSVYSYQKMGAGKLFLKIFIFSFLLSLVASLIYISVKMHGNYSNTVIPLACSGSFFLTAVISVFCFPGILLAKANSNKQPFAAYFLTPVIAMIGILFSSLQDGDLQFYFIIAASYTLVAGFFFFKKSVPENAVDKAAQTEEPV